jgi:hypothetical protein
VKSNTQPIESQDGNSDVHDEEAALGNESDDSLQDSNSINNESDSEVEDCDDAEAEEEDELAQCNLATSSITESIQLPGTLTPITGPPGRPIFLIVHVYFISQYTAIFQS